MKKWIAAGCLLASASVAMADESGPGCGFGALVFDGQSGLPAHVLAATTNGTSGSQTFGMSTGTLGCDPSKPINITAANFIDDNVDNIALDMSRGEGEHLDALATIMNIHGADRALFKQVLKQEFDAIYHSADVRAGDVMNGISKAMASQPELRPYLI